MPEDVLAIASEQAATPAIEQQQPEVVDQDEPIDLDSPIAEEPAQPSSETEVEGDLAPTAELQPADAEIEFNGKKYLVPEELKGAFMMNADYTRKTQETAEIRKQVDTLKAEAEANLAVSQEIMEAKAHLIGIESRLAQFQQVDWGRMEQEDPMGAMSAWREFQQLQQARETLNGGITKFQQQVSEQAEQETVARLRETRAFAEKNIPGWNDELDRKIVNFANAEGVPFEVLKASINPQYYKILHLAMIGQQALSRTTAAPRPQPATQPLRTITAKANTVVNKDPSDMSMDEYAKWSEKKFKK